MIVVVGRVTTDADKRAELVRVGEAVAAASREEAGCLNYRLYQSTDDENAFVFVEEWEDDAALQQHFATPHIATFMRDVAPLVTSPPEVRFHEVAGTRGLADMTPG